MTVDNFGALPACRDQLDVLGADSSATASYKQSSVRGTAPNS
jgi:hypothetical protein